MSGHQALGSCVLWNERLNAEQGGLPRAQASLSMLVPNMQIPIASGSSFSSVAREISVLPLLCKCVGREGWEGGGRCSPRLGE